MGKSILSENIEALKKRFPRLAEKLNGYSFEKIQIAKTEDGAYCYVQEQEDGRHALLSNSKNPLQAAQEATARMQHRLGHGLSPAVVVGLNPGIVLDVVFRHFESRLSFNEPFRHIYVIVTSIHTLAGWLKASDRTAILERDEISFHWHENVQDIVELCEKDIQRSHLFIPVSVLPENELNRIIEPLAVLYLRRKNEEITWHEENEEYYNSLTDEKLGKIISGEAGRKPRLLMPTHMSSTVVQYSTRDTCSAFEKMGWETMILKMERDLSPWLMIKTIHEFKPDLFIFINHLRTEDEGINMYPENMMFITWLQDAMPVINKRNSAKEWNQNAQKRKRDMFVGYTEQLKGFGYDENRLFPMGMVVNKEIFKPRMPTDEELKKYSCLVCFASNRGKPTDVILKEELLPYFEESGFMAADILSIHDKLWEKYRRGETITSYGGLEDFLLGFAGFKAAWRKLKSDERSAMLQKFYWTLNDVIYRHAVLEWLDECGADLHLYGKEWHLHPRFSKYDKGPLEHGAELAAAYRGASYCLHLNSLEGTHQRLAEIIECGGRPLMRVTKISNAYTAPELNKALISFMERLNCFGREGALSFDMDSIEDSISRELFMDWIFDGAYVAFSKKTDAIVSLNACLSPQLCLLDVPECLFDTKESLAKILSAPQKSISGKKLFRFDAPNIPETILYMTKNLMNISQAAVYDGRSGNTVLKLIDMAGKLAAIKDGNDNKAEAAGAIVDIVSHDYSSFHSIILKTAQMLQYSGYVAEAERLIAKLDFNKGAKYSLFKELAEALFNSVVILGRPESLLDLLDKIRKTGQFEREKLDLFTLRAAESLIMLGQPRKAEEQLAYLNFSEIRRPDFLDSLATSYLRLGALNDAKLLLAYAEKEGLQGQSFRFNKAQLEICSWNYEKALDTLLSTEAAPTPISTGDELNRICVTNFLGRFDDTLSIAEEISKTEKANTVSEPYVTETARALREIGRFDEALSRFNTEFEMRPGINLWRWILRFEYALTFISQGMNEKAKDIVRAGARLQAIALNNCFNPCVFLYHAMLVSEDSSYIPDTPVEEWTANASLWPAPFRRYKQWMLMLTAATAKSQNKNILALEAINAILDDPIILQPGKGLQLREMLEKTGGQWGDEEFLSRLASALWPFLPPDAFEINMFKYISGMTNKHNKRFEGKHELK